MNTRKIDLIIKKLKEINPEKVILFGSYAYGKPTPNSDVDLIVVTNDNFYPKDYDENMSIYLRVSSILRDIKRKIPIDLIVHTKPMHERFLQLNSIFSREVLKNGKVIYEKDYS